MCVRARGVCIYNNVGGNKSITTYVPVGTLPVIKRVDDMIHQIHQIPRPKQLVHLRIP